MKNVTRYIFPDRKIQDVEGITPPAGVAGQVEVEGSRYVIESIEARPDVVGTIARYEARGCTYFVRLRNLTPMEREELAPKPERPPEPSPRYRIPLLFSEHEDVSPSEDVVVGVKRGVPRDEWARQLRKLADQEVSE